MFPVIDGEAATLYCRVQPFPAVFYNDWILIGSKSMGNMSIHNFAKLHEGVYMCNISGAGKSPGTWLYISDTCKLLLQVNRKQFVKLYSIFVTADSACHLCSTSHRDCTERHRLSLLRPLLLCPLSLKNSFHHFDGGSPAVASGPTSL